MGWNIVLIVVGLALIVAAGMARSRACRGRRIGWSDNVGAAWPGRIVGLAGFVLVVWGATQLQVRFIGGWAWLVLVALAAALVVPVAVHNLGVDASSRDQAGTVR